MREENTGMPDEVDYVAHLLDLHTALKRLQGLERDVARRAWWLWEQDGSMERALAEYERQVKVEMEVQGQGQGAAEGNEGEGEGRDRDRNGSGSGGSA